jgi:alpha-D-xyloside xylohydrolase
VWGRSGWAGSQRYPGQWGGDAESTVAGMQATVRGGLSYAVSAPGFWSHDIGGFFGPELTPGLYVRWTQMGALSPLMRAHGLRPREPWAFGEEALAAARRWVRLRYELLPTIWQVAHESAANGWPVMRPVGLEFPDDMVARSVDDTFMVGSDLLVVPVFDDGSDAVRRRFYVPAGRWHDLLDGTVYEGPAFHEADVALDAMPVLARDGAVLPRVAVDDGVRSTEDLEGRPWTLHAYGAAADTTVSLRGFDGTVTTVRLRGSDVTSEGSQAVSAVVRHG